MRSFDQEAQDPGADQLIPDLPEPPDGVDQRTFLMRSAMIGAVTVLNGAEPGSAEATTKKAAAASAAAPKVTLSPDLDVVKKSKGR